MPRWQCLVEVTAPGDFPSRSVETKSYTAASLATAANKAKLEALKVYPTAEVLAVRRTEPKIEI